MVDNLLSAVELPAGWEQWGIAGAGLAVAGLAFVVGRRLLTPRPVAASPVENTAPAPDPFIEGSASEKRVAARRKGACLDVWLTNEQQGGSPQSARVADRSLGGLGLSCPHHVAPGTILKVRPKDAPTMAPWVEVEVRSCNPEEGAWLLGCAFCKTPPYSVLLLFG
jgi:hypothetical protein